MGGGERLGTLRAWLRSRAVTCGRLLVVAVAFSAAALPLLVLMLVSLGLTGALGLGLPAFVLVVAGVRRLAGRRRDLAGRWTGTSIPIPYRDEPAPARSRVITALRSARWLLTDPATWRDLLWLLCIPINLVLGGVPVAMVVYGLEGVAVVPLVGPRLRGGWEYGLGWLVDLPGESLLAVPQGALLVAVGLWVAPIALRRHDQLARHLLSPARTTQLELRVDRLSRTRADAVDAQAAELRRIERDLHDGAQARLIALGMSLGLAEQLFDSQPATARRLLAEARLTGGQALTDLRDLVRGIHPPVLSERGLAAAVEALALALPVPIAVRSELSDRLPAPLESAGYFAIAEVLANVVRHSRADHAWVSLEQTMNQLLIVVRDDGIGGADPHRGSGLRGIEHRIGAFDGKLRVSSPIGGPTVVTMEIPCALFSPKTSPSSGTA